MEQIQEQQQKAFSQMKDASFEAGPSNDHMRMYEL
jgi:hypothetical protein